MHFVFTVCDRAADEMCPGLARTSFDSEMECSRSPAVVGTQEQVERAFLKVFSILDRRISLFLALPLTSHERDAIHGEIDRVGRE